MRPDQLERLGALAEKLAEVVLEEADPDNWPGAGTPVTGLSKEQRGDRYWSKKNAAMTLVLLNDLAKVAANTKEALGRDPYTEPELDARIDKAEAQAARLLDEVAKAAKKAAFDKKTHGKAA